MFRCTCSEKLPILLHLLKQGLSGIFVFQMLFKTQTIEKQINYLLHFNDRIISGYVFK